MMMPTFPGGGLSDYLYATVVLVPLHIGGALPRHNIGLFGIF